MRRTLLGIAAVDAVLVVVTGPARAALREVRVGNFYYEDSTVDDGKVEATVGDQLKFVVQDGGPGTPHTVEVDELNIHSGSIGSGKTYTTPPLQTAGTFKLYCKPHEAKGHKTTLIVYNAGEPIPFPTTTAPAAATPSTTRAVAGPATTVPKSAVQTTPTVKAGAGVTTTTAGSAAPGAAGPANLATSDTVASGTGEASADELANAPIVPGSLESVLGRRPASRGPWTRSVRMALAALPPMLLAAAFAVRRLRATPDDPTDL
ncbi:MAG TPA: hypothetical protein VFB78_17180 [Acidimicrobiales bacterium]|nr:hypothetical protein [Acidimicrobiales bacterium]